MTSVLDSIYASLKGEIAGEVHRNHSLARFTTYRLGGPAALYVEPADTGDVETLARVLDATGDVEEIPLLTLGRGSNLVVSDQGWPGIVIRLTPSKWSWIEPLEEFPAITAGGRRGLVAGAATSLPLLANWAARRGLAGLEFLIAIPGSVGGAVRMNAGAHGSAVGECLVGVRIFDVATGEVGIRDPSELDLDYRTSNLSDRHLVLFAAFALDPGDAIVVRSRLEEFRAHRAATQPGAVQNAGSVFKNPPGDHAGRLVEAAGLKGLRVGGAHVSSLHANFFIADEGASAQDVFDLVCEVRARVREGFDVQLDPEIRFAGTFQSRSGALQGEAT